MAQSGYTPIQLYYSTTGLAQPLAADLRYGELALNVADGKLYYKDLSNAVQLLVSAGTGGGTVTNVNGSGGTTGLTLTGGPITNTGTLTLGGTLAVANGGTGNTAYTDGQLLIGNTSTGGLTKATLTAGSNVTITNAGGAITIAASGTGGGVTSVGAVAPATSTGGSTPNIGIAHSGGACTTTTGVGALVFNTAPSLSSPILTTPVLGTPQSGNLSNCSGYTYANLGGTIPTWNQNTTGNAATATTATTAGTCTGNSATVTNGVYTNTTQSITGAKTFTSLTSGGTTAVTMGSATPAGVGINSQAYNFTAGTSIYRDITGTFPIVIANGTGQFLHQNNGDFTITGSVATKASGTTWANPSDARLKDNVVNYTDGISKLMQVQPKTWKYNGKGGTTAGTKGIGVIADEIQSVLPGTVGTYKAKLNPNDANETDIKQFDATEITWLLVNAVKELKAEIDALKAAQ